ncbi:cobalamin-dependent protein [Solwaraspora sp. WMMD406]|uniref:cobalamin B12-binding domain-containing protein n=1 Tax=Solwaraspora sp. WMMD406 TaxID=3016095 RepID=UPI0024160113|nr:cobalamin-dependent protein [Solwaraspora sp. WMMD406]MDG4766304.1 cobalamin-dependent protein [Solwaraspora sp. WMMD406]
MAAPSTLDLASAYPAFLSCLAAADEIGALELADELLTTGVAAESVLLELIVPAQVQVGRWWQSNEWSVAQEHAATHISELVVSAVTTRSAPRPYRGRVIVACMDGEWHALPPRLVAEVLRLRGWQVTFLGASVPAVHLMGYLHRHDASALALACALPMRLPQAHRMIESCRRADVPILVGGRGFGPDGRWARKLGVVWASDARRAADLLAEGGDALSGPGTGTGSLGGEEYVGLISRRAEIIDLGLDDLRRRQPSVADYTVAQWDATVADLGHIVDFLAAAVYVDDEQLFTESMRWTRDVLAARGVSVAGVMRTLSVYVETLRDFPRAGAFLRAGRRALWSVARG